MRSLLIFGLGITLQAQSVVSMTGPTQSKSGNTVTINLNLVSGKPISGLQWDFVLPTGYTTKVTTGPATVTAGKTIDCVTSHQKCVETGMNQTPIADGVIAIYSLNIPPNAPAGKVDITLSDLVAGDGIGIEVPLTQGTPYSIQILAKQDLNSDGFINETDVNIMRSQRLGTIPCTDDQNGDSVCDVIDVLLIIKAALGV